MNGENRVVVTGMGVISSFGSNISEFWHAIRNGYSAIQAWQPEGVDNFPVRYAATVDFDQMAKRHSNLLPKTVSLERRGIFGMIASCLALEDGGYRDGDSLGVCVCSGVPGVSDEDLAMMCGNDDEQTMENVSFNRSMLSSSSGIRCGNDAMAGEIAKRVGANGPVINVNGACAGAAQAIGQAFQAVRRGEVDRIVAGGADSVLNIRTMAGLYLLGAASTAGQFGSRLCRPFDSGRSGLVAAEGGAMLLLESESAARRRNAPIYGEVLGYGSSLDAYKVTAPHPRGEGAKQAMRLALEDAKLEPGDIGYINAHGTSTSLNDVIETKAIKSVFANCAAGMPKISSTKSMIGHWIAACGAPEVIVTMLAVKNGEIPPTINLDKPDPQCDLDYVAKRFLPNHVKFAMSNSFGFGGINASLIVGMYRQC